MEKEGYIISLIFSGAMIFYGCKKPYLPAIVASDSNYLVVEGVINSGQDSTIIKLSRTANISDKITANPESGAVVTVESHQTTIYQLKETSNGYYASPALNLNNSQKYHLRIKTAAGKEYLSDDEPVKTTPPIDSIGFTIQNNGILLYVNAHDPNNGTRYYRWDYTETWNFHAEYQAQYITDGKAIHLRTGAQQIFTCFGNQTSNAINLGSTAKLAKDEIFQNPVTQVSSTSEKLETRYSIVVKQYALTSDAYNFWVNLKKNTEQLGSIYDALPSEVPGNIHCITTPSEPVIGYVSVSTISQKRIFIDNSQLPLNWKATYPYDCELDSLLFCRPPSCQNDVQLFMIPINYTDLGIAPIMFGQTLGGYFGAPPECADCTIRGTTKTPSFWR